MANILNINKSHIIYDVNDIITGDYYNYCLGI